MFNNVSLCNVFVGVLVRYGNSKSIKDVSGPMAERLFDQTIQVREAVTQTVGDWLMNMPDRYSYFHIMIPLILTRYCFYLLIRFQQMDGLKHILFQLIYQYFSV